MTLIRVELRRPNLEICKSHNINQIVGTNTSFAGLTMKSNGQLISGLTKEDQARLEDALGLPKGELNPVHAKGNQDPTYWDTFIWKLPDTGRTILDTDGPYDELIYHYLKAKTRRVASSLEDLKNKPNAELVLIEAGSEANAAVKNNSYKKKAYIKTGDFSTEEQQTLIMVYGEATRQQVDTRSMSPDALTAKVDEMIEGNAQEVLKLLDHPEYKTQAKIAELYNGGVIEKRNDAYYNTDGALLGRDLEDMVIFMKDKTRAQEVANLYKRLKK